MNYKTHKLSNGFRLIYQKTNRKVAYCALIINTGTRDELDNEHGVAHFIEHMLFKGTEKRKAYHIISRMEDVGGEIDAYTTKEETCIHTSFLAEHYDRTLELLSDMVFNSKFPEKEIEKEKKVIIDEIESYNDSPSELIFDEFEEIIFSNNNLGRNILGTKKTVKSFKVNNLKDFYNRAYNTDQMVMCFVGNVEFEELIKSFTKYYNNIPEKKRNFKRVKFENYSPKQIEISKKTHQAHCVVGTTAYNINNNMHIVLSLLNEILGGAGLNSRLNLSLREKNGLAYYIESSFMPYSDTGIFNIYFGCEKNKINKSLSIIKSEINKLKLVPLGKQQLVKAKKQMLGHIAISLENPENLLLNLGKSYLLFNKVDSLEIISEKIEKINSDDILKVANEIFNFDNFSSLIYK